MKRILSIQGGGLRGILPACALVALEQQTGKLTRDCFDAVAGTSTGALLASAIAAGVPAQQSLDVYIAEGKRIFSPVEDFRRTYNLVTTGRMFDARVLHAVLVETLGPKASNWTINDSPIKILITACDQLGDTMYFTQDAPSNARTFGKYSLVDATVASACATTYHDPWECGNLGHLADGGCGGVADPVYSAAVEFFSGYKCFGSIEPSDSVVISLGTGFYRPPTMPEPPDSLLNRIQWVTGALVGSSKTIAAQSVDRHWPNVLKAFNAALPSDIDEAQVSAIPALLDIGHAMAKKLDWRTILSI